MERRFRAAEFFAGIGLVKLALEKRGWEVVFANDIDPEKFEMYRANFGRDHFVLADIHKLAPDRVPACDLFTASFPCNDLSIAGAWEGLNGRQSSAFWGFVDLLKALGDRRPPLVLLENVVGFLQSHRGKDFESALLALNELGYAVDAFILNAVHWVPQSRPRLFVVAKRFVRKHKTTLALATDARPDMLQAFIFTHQHIDWDIRDLPALPKPVARLSDIVEDLPDDDPRWWNRQRADYFFGQLSERHRREAEAMIRGRTYSYATAFRRVRHARSMAELRTDGNRRVPSHSTRRQRSTDSLQGRQGQIHGTLAHAARMRSSPRRAGRFRDFRLAQQGAFWLRRRRLRASNRVDRKTLPHAAREILAPGKTATAASFRVIRWPSSWTISSHGTCVKVSASSPLASKLRSPCSNAYARRRVCDSTPTRSQAALAWTPTKHSEIERTAASAWRSSTRTTVADHPTSADGAKNCLTG